MKNTTTATIRDAFAKSERTLATERVSLGRDINLSTIATLLIQNVGRFAESYASDFVISWDVVRDIVRNAEPGTSYIEVFAIRRSGVDGNNYLMSNLRNTFNKFTGFSRPEDKYRKILALGIELPLDGGIEMVLKDITDDCYKLNKEDCDAD